jgi:hypothetical protein
MELRNALLETYNSDAYMTMYAAEGQKKIHRVNQVGYPLYPHPLNVTVFCADYDTVDHQPWPEGREEELARPMIDRWRQAPILQGAIFHTTLKGIHIIQPLQSPIPIGGALSSYRWWLDMIREAGVEWDKATAKEVGRLWRMPRVRRSHNGKMIDYKPSVLLLDDAVPLKLPARLAGAPAQQSAGTASVAQSSLSAPRKTARIQRAELGAQQVPDVGEPWCFRAKIIAAACKSEPHEWHRMFMHLAGALLEKGAPASRLVAICRAISIETGADDRIADREQSAKTTLDRMRLGNPVGGYQGLLKEWRSVALALEESFSIRTQEDFERYNTPTATKSALSGAEVSALIREQMPKDGDGVTAYQVGAGVGKSAAAIDEGASRARGVARSASGRAPRGSKTAYSVDKHELAKQYQRDLAAKGIEAKRLFSPLTVLQDDGTPECIHHDKASHLVEGGLSMQWELCRGRDTERCERYETCRARLGFDGPEDALITIGTHARIEALAEEAGSTGTLYADEPPSVFEKHVISPAELKIAVDSLHDFTVRFECAMRPALEALRAWHHCEIPGPPRAPVDVVREYGHQVSAADIHYAQAQTGVESRDPVDFAAAALAPDEHHGRGQLPLRPIGRHMAIMSVTHAARIGQAARTLGAVHRALTSTLPGAAIWLEESGSDAGSIVLYQPRDSYIQALRRQGKTILLDANASSSVPLLAPLLGYEPVVRRFEATDGARIERTWRMAPGANRSGWFDGQLPVPCDSLLHAIHAALEWAHNLGTARPLAIITMRAIELGLRLAHRPGDEEAMQAWSRLKPPPKLLERFQTEFGPALKARSGALLWGHYGAIKGLNHMADVDAILTIGDPWPNVMCAEHEAKFAALDQTGRARGEQLCKDELEQAHGRLRTVHRTRPGWALHVGAVRPGGTAWLSEVQVVQAAGRPVNARVLTPDEIKQAVDQLGGARAAGKFLQCSERTVRRYVTGDRAPDAAIVEALLPLVRWRAA